MPAYYGKFERLPIYAQGLDCQTDMSLLATEMSRILVIEDDDQARRLYEELLKEEGFEVLSFASGEEGVDAYDVNQIDLVITDIFLPGIDGIQVTKAIHEHNPDVKVIAISGGPNPNKENKKITLPNDIPFLRIFRKPFSIDMLIAEIRNLLPSEE